MCNWVFLAYSLQVHPSVFGNLRFQDSVFRHGFLFLCPAWDLCFLNPRVYIFNQFCKIHRHFLCRLLLLSSSRCLFSVCGFPSLAAYLHVLMLPVACCPWLTPPSSPASTWSPYTLIIVTCFSFLVLLILLFLPNYSTQNNTLLIIEAQ